MITPKNASNPILSFETAPVEGERPEGVRFLAYGDLGVGFSENTVKRLKALVKENDLIWHIGDLAYADNWPQLHTTYEAIYEQWLDNMTDIMSVKPYMTLPVSNNIWLLKQMKVHLFLVADVN